MENQNEKSNVNNSNMHPFDKQEKKTPDMASFNSGAKIPLSSRQSSKDIFEQLYGERKRENRLSNKDVSSDDASLNNSSNKTVKTPTSQAEHDAALSEIKKVSAFKETSQTKALDRPVKILYAENSIPSHKKVKDKNNLSVILCSLFGALSVLLIISSVVFLFAHKNNDSTSENTSSNGGEIVEENKNMSFSFPDPFRYENKYDNVKFPEGIQEKFKPLYAQNKQLAGWLYVPNTGIDFAVYQNPGDNVYYLRHDNFATYNKYGVPFLDGAAGIKNLSRNTTVYAHNFDNDLLFSRLEKFDDLQFYKKTPILKYNTIYKDYTWKIFAAFRTNGLSTGDNGYLFYYPAANMSDANFMSFYDHVMQRSYWKTTVDVLPTDKIITLSTCTHVYFFNGEVHNARFVVMARLLRDGESEAVDVDSAKENDNIRHPQIYYDYKGIANPYKNASKWYPEK